MHPGHRGAAGNCNYEELAEKGKNQYAIGQLVAALASYESALACKPDPAYAEKAFIIACNLPQVEKAKPFWKQMPPLMRQRALAICCRNGITEEMLDAP